MTENLPESLQIVYDGECPFCSEYLKVLRLRDAAKTVELISARDPHPLVDEVLKLGFDLDEGMVAKVGEVYYHGADCVHILSLMSTPSGVFNNSSVTSSIRFDVTIQALNSFFRCVTSTNGRKSYHPLIALRFKIAHWCS